MYCIRIVSINVNSFNNSIKISGAKPFGNRQCDFLLNLNIYLVKSYVGFCVPVVVGVQTR